MTTSPLIDRMVDSIFGPVTQIAQQPADDTEPPGLVTYSAAVSDLGPYLSWLPDRSGTGCGFDPVRAQNAAIGEAVERYCGNYVADDEVRVASYKSLQDQHVCAVRPLDVWPFESSDASAAFGRFALPGDEDEIGWTLLRTPDGGEIHVPAAQVFLNYHRARPDERRSFPVVLPGIAAGPDRSGAITSAALEVLERDATSLWWIGSAPAVHIRPSRDLQVQLTPSIAPGIEQESYLLRTYGAEARVFAVAHVLLDRRNDSLQVGFACRSDLEEAIAKAAAEAWQLRRLDLAVRDLSSWVWRSHGGRRPLPVLEPETFTDSRGSEPPLAAMTQLVHNVQFYAGNRRRQELALETMRARVTDAADSADFQDESDELDLISLARAEGIDLFWKDLTTLDVRDLGMTVVRVYSPTACPNMATAFPPLGNPRLRALLDKTERQPNLDPLPHA